MYLILPGQVTYYFPDVWGKIQS